MQHALLGEDLARLYTRGIERVAAWDPYAGLLALLDGVGLVNGGHGLSALHAGNYSDFPAVQASIEFGTSMSEEGAGRAVGQSSRYATRPTRRGMGASYKLLQVFDQYAQFLCSR